MTSKVKPPDGAAELRQRAETLARQDHARVPDDLFSSPEKTRRTLYELRVHQIELEMQNEELRRVQVELEESRQRYFDLYDLAPVGYCTLSSKGLILEVNLTAANLLNVTRSALIKQPISRFILREDQDIFHMYRRHLFKTAGPQSGELRMLRANSPPFWARLDATVVFDKNRAALCRLVIIDNSERKQMESALQQSRDGLEDQVKERTTQLAAAMQEAEAGRQQAESALVEINKLKSQLEAEKAYLTHEISLQHNHEQIIGQSDAITYVLYKVEQIAGADTTVLLLGETGTGKELVARAVHGLSRRKNRSLVKVNCAVLQSNLIENELFGHEKGAFTGAVAKHLGLFEVADGATIFLDEIGELPFDLQAKLLRVLQDGELERLGSTRTIKIDTRVIAATNRNLEEAVRKGRFREDLWYRLNVFPITLPPLRDRKNDIPLLAEFFVRKIAKRMGKTIDIIPARVMEVLQDYAWPGNIRELENVLERAVINSPGSKLQLADALKKPPGGLSTRVKTLAAVERDYIVQVLEQTQWKVSGKNSAAEILGLNRSTLRARMRKLDIRNN